MFDLGYKEWRYMMIHDYSKCERSYPASLYEETNPEIWHVFLIHCKTINILLYLHVYDYSWPYSVSTMINILLDTDWINYDLTTSQLSYPCLQWDKSTKVFISLNLSQVIVVFSHKKKSGGELIEQFWSDSLGLINVRVSLSGALSILKFWCCCASKATSICYEIQASATGYCHKPIQMGLLQ